MSDDVSIGSDIPDRYAANPMLAVLENYILDALGKLPADKAALLNEIVCRTFGGSDWRAIIRNLFGLPEDSAASLAAAWKQRCEQADAEQIEVSPEDFARESADQVIRDSGGV